jgi:hypothetical protein
MRNKYSLLWHLANALIGFVLFFVVAFTLMLSAGLIAGMPAQSGVIWSSQRFGAQIFVAACGAGILFVSMRVVWTANKRLKSSTPHFGGLFYIKQCLKYLIVMIVLVAIPAIAIPFIKVFQRTWIELGIFAFATLLTFILSSVGADKQWLKQTKRFQNNQVNMMTPPD